MRKREEGEASSVTPFYEQTVNQIVEAFLFFFVRLSLGLRQTHGQRRRLETRVGISLKV